MDFGIHIGTRGCLTSRENVMAVAQCAEALGYAYLGVSDHLIVPVRSEVRYPYTADGRLAGRRHRRLLRLHRDAGLPRRLHAAHQAADLGCGGAIPAGRADGEAVHDGGRAVRRPRHCRRRCRLDAGGVRRARRAAIRRARRSDRRIPGGLAVAVDRCDGRRTTANMQSSTMWCSRRSQHRSRIRRSGSAARAPLRCDAR